MGSIFSRERANDVGDPTLSVRGRSVAVMATRDGWS
jgi:hypothetical protein